MKGDGWLFGWVYRCAQYPTATCRHCGRPWTIRPAPTGFAVRLCDTCDAAPTIDAEEATQ